MQNRRKTVWYINNTKEKKHVTFSEYLNKIKA